VTVRPVLDRIPHFAELLLTTEEREFEDLRLAEGTGRPLGTAEFVAGLERLLGRPIARRAPGRKPTVSITGVQLKLLQ
jgi:putative transposase